MVANLSPDKFTVRDIYIDKTGQWHITGRPATPEEALRSLDVALIGLHGEYGEDGEVQKLLERFGVPYSGSDSFSSFVAMHKMLTKQRALEEGILTPQFRYVEDNSAMEDTLRDVIRSFHQPVIVKPVRWGSSVGIQKVGGYAPLHTAVTGLLREGAGGVLVEEVITGREATIGVVENMRGEELYVLPAIEIVPPEGDFFSYDAKYSGKSHELCPAHFQKKVADELARAARTMHKALGLRHYSRSDFIVTPKGIYYLETNSLPGMTKESLLPKSLAAVGVTFPQFMEHLVDLSLGNV